MKSKKEYLIILLTLICLVGSSFLFQSSEKSAAIFKKNVFSDSNCLISGTSSSKAKALVITAKGNDTTSGINTWYCYKNNSWSTCLNHSGCNSLELSGWTGITKIQTEDVAGNQSDVISLYSTKTANYSGERNNGNSFSDQSPNHINSVKIINSTSTYGSISDVSIEDRYNYPSQVIVTGTPQYYSYKNKTYTYTSAKMEKKTYVCAAGKPKYEGNVWKCVGDDYRLQNETCTCVFQKKNDGSFEKYDEWSKVTDNSITCARVSTYCTDKYDKSASADVKIKAITSNTSETGDECNQAVDGDGCFSNSGNYIRKPNSTCFTYYIKDGNDNYYKSNFTRNDFMYYFDFYSLLTKNYDQFTINPGMKKIMIEASENLNAPCSSYNTNENYYSSSSLLDSSNSLCDTLLKKFNNSKNDLSKFNYTSMQNNVYLIPVTSSATCEFQEGNASAKKPTYPGSITIGSGEDEYYVYCPSGTIVKRNGSYECEHETEYNYNGYKYDWTVQYYRK